MPNFPLPNGIRTHLRRRAEKLSARPLNLALGSFPLDTDQVQLAILSQDQRDRMQQLVDEGVKTIEKHHELRLAMLRTEFPGIRRSAVVILNMPQSVFVQRATLYSVMSTRYSCDESHYLLPTYEHLSDTDKQALATWVERCVRQTRLNEITLYCVNSILDEKVTPTSTHLIALWPELAGLIDPSSVMRSEQDYCQKWVERLRNPVRRNYRAYKPAPALLEKYGKLMQAANVQLAAGSILNDYQHKQGHIKAFIEHWERLDNDLRFP